MPTKNGNDGSLHDFADDESAANNGEAGEQGETTRQRARKRSYTPPYERSARRSSDDRNDAFNALAWLVEGAVGLIDEFRHNDLGLPEDFWVHTYAARREMLLAVRAVIDDALAEDDSAEQSNQRRERRGGINIEF